LRKDGIERRDAILDAALACFASGGLLATGIEDIRKRAGASPSSVYHFFADVNAITLALLLRTYQRLFAHLIARVTVHKSAKASVEALVAAHLDWVFAHRAEARFMYQATALELVPDQGEVLTERKNEMLGPLLAHIEPFMARGTLPAWSPLELDIVLLGQSHEASRRFLSGGPLDEAWMRDNLPGLAWGAVSREARAQNARSTTVPKPSRVT
jgi:AcrR family transcriptional regulator